jgi:hypothetical protein
MKINSTPIPNSTVLGDSAGNLFLRGEHPDKRSDKEFIELMRQRGYERNTTKGRMCKGVRCNELNKDFRSFRECERFFGMGNDTLRQYFLGMRKTKKLIGYTFKVLSIFFALKCAFLYTV